ncbi:MAG: hypothetical protein ABFD49_04795 [Armatimonadota bacterium]
MHVLSDSVPVVFLLSGAAVAIAEAVFEFHSAASDGSDDHIPYNCTVHFTVDDYEIWAMQ